MSDPVSSPDHYAGSIECKDAMKAMAWGVGLTAMAYYWWLSAFKYLWRWPRKNGIEDLKKCKQCIDFLIEEVGE